MTNKLKIHFKHFLIGSLIAALGAGTYVIAAVVFSDFTSGTTISSTEMNTKLNALKNAINNPTDPTACVTTAVNSQLVVAGANFGIVPTACAAGYSLVSVGCRAPIYNSANWAIIGHYGASSAGCWGTNIDSVSRTFEAYGRCCRVPGLL